MVNNIKKIAASVLINSTMGKLIRSFYGRQIPYNGAQIYCPTEFINDRSVAQLFFRVYEKQEYRFVNQYLLPNLPVVELGSSIGVISIQILNKGNRPIHLIEANPFLLDILRQNIEANVKQKGEYFIHNLAIHPSSTEGLFFKKGKSNITGRLTNEATADAIKVPTISLSAFLKREQIDGFILVCDIEGAELPLLLEDGDALKNCHQLIIETHRSTYKATTFNAADYSAIIQELGFTEIQKHGRNYIFNKT